MTHHEPGRGPAHQPDEAPGEGLRAIEALHPNVRFEAVCAWVDGVDEARVRQALPELERLLADTPPGLRVAPRVWCDAFLHTCALGPRWSLVRHLSLASRPVSHRHLEVVARAPELSALQLLDLSYIPIRERGARTLATGPGLRGLRSLVLRDCALWPDAIEALVSGEPFPWLDDLTLYSNSIGKRGAEALARSEVFPRLTHVGFDQGSTGALGAARVQLSPQLRLLGVARRFPYLRRRLYSEPVRMSDDARFGLVRSLLAEGPSPERWFRLCVLLECWTPERLRAQVLPYVSGHLERWPDALRTLPAGWVWTPMGSGQTCTWALCPSPLHTLCRSVSFGEALRQERDMEVAGQLVPAYISNGPSEPDVWSTVLGLRARWHTLGLAQPLSDERLGAFIQALGGRPLQALRLGSPYAHQWYANASLVPTLDALRQETISTVGVQELAIGVEELGALALYKNLAELDLRGARLGGRGSAARGPAQEHQRCWSALIAMIEDGAWPALTTLRATPRQLRGRVELLVSDSPQTQAILRVS